MDWPGQITPETLKAMVLQLSPDGGPDDDAEQIIREELERRFERDLTRALRDQVNELLPDGATDEQIRAAVNQVEASSNRVQDVLRRQLQDGAELGVSVSVNTLDNIGLGFDWTLANNEAARWAQSHSGELIRGINSTSRQRVQTAVDNWFRERTTLDDLRKELEPMFGRQRARLIAQTESTRAAAEGSILGYEASGQVAQKEWVAVGDELVCPQCGRLHGQRVPLRAEFESGVTNPPAHPACRCFVRPIVREEGDE